MSGFAGIARSSGRPIVEDMLWEMAASIRHRGPDDWNVCLPSPGGRVGFSHVQSGISDHAAVREPLPTIPGRLVVAFDGDVYNSQELKQELESAGYRFRTSDDAELLVHAYERWGEAMLDRLNGQFAFALYDPKHELVFLARDRFGIRPLFIAIVRGDLYFASEVKALVASGEVEAALDLRGLDEAFSLCGARAPRTVFRGVEQLEPGCCATWVGGRLRTRRYYDARYSEAATEPDGAIETLDALMQSAVSLRMRADVPVGGYLGGFDSTIACALASRMTSHRLPTFSVTVDDPQLDEGEFQRVVAKALRTEHHVVHVGHKDIAGIFPEVIWHTETPLLGTTPAPMYLLARATRDAGVKVVLTGEGSDEFFLGYDLFKETMVRLFCLRRPDSRLRPRLFDRLYPALSATPRTSEFWRRFFLTACSVTDPLFSHAPRFQLAARIKDFYSPELRVALAGSDSLAELRQSVPDAFLRWSPANRAAYLEVATALPSYLLSSQGDRMSMAYGIARRSPFLDHRVFEYAASLPTSSKLLGLRDKEILRRWATRFIPANVCSHLRRPQRSPGAAAFFSPSPPDYVRELLSREAIRRTGIFDPVSVAGLVRRCVAGRVTGVGENQALVAILSTQLWHQRFLQHHMEVPTLRAVQARRAVVLE